MIELANSFFFYIAQNNLSKRKKISKKFRTKSKRSNIIQKKEA